MSFESSRPPYANHYFKGTNRSAVAVAANTNTNYATFTDPGGNWNPTLNRFTTPATGRYRVTLAWKWNGSTTTGVPGRVVVAGSAAAYSPQPPNVAFGGWTIEWVGDVGGGVTIASQFDSAYTTQPDGANVDNNYLIIQRIA